MFAVPEDEDLAVGKSAGFISEADFPDRVEAGQGGNGSGRYPYCVVETIRGAHWRVDDWNPTGLLYLNWRRRQAAATGEGYGEGHLQEPVAAVDVEHLPSPLIAISPLVLVGVLNKILTDRIPLWYGESHSFLPAGAKTPIVTEISKLAAIWAVEGALLVGILAVLVLAFRPVIRGFAEGSKAAVSGALLASMNTASEYGFGAVIASLPGFLLVASGLQAISDPLLNEAVRGR